jgi:hypothetical protein
MPHCVICFQNLPLDTKYMYKGRYYCDEHRPPESMANVPPES